MDAFKKAIRVLMTISTLVSLVFLWLNRGMFMSLLGIPAGGPQTPAGTVSAAGTADPNAVVGTMPQGPDGALKLATMISTAAPNNLQAQMAAGAIYLRQDKPDEAMAAFKKAEQIDPTNVPARFQIGMILMKHEKFNEAEKEFREVIRLDPTHTDGRFGLAAVLQKHGTLDDAAAVYKEILQLKPLSADAHNGLAVLYDAQGSKEKALVEFKRAFDLAPNDPVIKKNFDDLTSELANALPAPPPPSPTQAGPPPSDAPVPAQSSYAGAETVAAREEGITGPDTLVLTNGRTVKGKIVEKTDSGVWLEFGSGRIYFTNSEISESK